MYRFIGLATAPAAGVIGRPTPRASRPPRSPRAHPAHDQPPVLHVEGRQAAHTYTRRRCCEHSCLDTVGGPCPPLPAVSARAVSSARLVWCVSSCRAAFAFLFFSVASPLLSARCARAGRSAPCARCSGTVPAAPRAARCASGSSSCCTAHWASPHDCHCFPHPLGWLLGADRRRTRTKH